jgi:hypothetical protein
MPLEAAPLICALSAPRDTFVRLILMRPIHRQSLTAIKTTVLLSGPSLVSGWAYGNLRAVGRGADLTLCEGEPPSLEVPDQ